MGDFKTVKLVDDRCMMGYRTLVVCGECLEGQYERRFERDREW